MKEMSFIDDSNIYKHTLALLPTVPYCFLRNIPKEN